MDKKEVEYLEITTLNIVDKFGEPTNKYCAEFSFALDSLNASFKVSQNHRGLGNEPYDCKGISETDAKKVLMRYKKIKANNDPESDEDETEFKI